MIEVKNLIKRFGPITAVDDVSFCVRPGEVLGFLGPNGAGKSTTMRMITGYLQQDGGSVSIGGHDVQDSPIEAKSQIGYLPESAPLYDEMKVKAFLSFTAAMRGLSGKAKRIAIDRAADLCQLQPVLRQSINTLSKGYRHRTCFAQALIHDPQVLILDEPTDGLDPNQKHGMRRLIKQMGETKAIIISTHILEEVDAACSRVAIIDKGRMIFDGSPNELIARSRTNGTLLLRLVGISQDWSPIHLQSLPEVDKVDIIHQEAQTIVLRIHPSKPRNGLQREISNVCHQSGWQIMELREDQGRLDEVFRELTLGEAG